MRPAGWETIDHTGDVGIRVWASTRADLFLLSAQAMYALCLEGAPTEGARIDDLRLEAESAEALLFEWLHELHARLAIDEVVYARFEFGRLEPQRLEVRLTGEALEAQRHRPFTEIKAVTWHDLALEEEGGSFEARVIFDV